MLLEAQSVGRIRGTDEARQFLEASARQCRTPEPQLGRQNGRSTRQAHGFRRKDQADRLLNAKNRSLPGRCVYRVRLGQPRFLDLLSYRTRLEIDKRGDAASLTFEFRSRCREIAPGQPRERLVGGHDDRGPGRKLVREGRLYLLGLSLPVVCQTSR